jgi:hypothetical protein
MMVDAKDRMAIMGRRLLIGDVIVSNEMPWECFPVNPFSKNPEGRTGGGCDGGGLAGQSDLMAYAADDGKLRKL